MAEALGKSRSHIANLVRLLQLPEDVIDMVREGALSAGHARALVTASAPSSLASTILKKGLSVRQTEALVKKSNQEIEDWKAGKPPKEKVASNKDADTKALEGDLSAALGRKVQVNHKGDQDSGEVVVSYKSLDDLDEICRVLSAR